MKWFKYNWVSTYFKSIHNTTQMHVFENINETRLTP